MWNKIRENDVNRKMLIEKWLGYVGLSWCLMVVFLAIGEFKLGYHVDEIYTFGLSNHQYETTHSVGLKVEDGVHYTGEELWDEYLTVSDGNRFDYANVWENQVHDVHPPLYYILIHTASSLFPNMSVKKIGFMVNIPLALIVFWQLVWIIQRLNIKKNTAIILALTYIMSYCFIDYAVVFFRMYTLLAVWMNFLIMIFLKYPAEDKGEMSYYMLLGLVLFGGVLTQYYFMIYAFFVCAIYAIYVILNKNWGKLICSIITAAIAGGFVLLIFPGIKYHIFESSRGKQAFENVSSEGFLETLWQYLELINSYVFGGLFTVLIAVLICLLIILSMKKKKKQLLYSYVLLIMPVCLYVLVVAKIAPYQTLRYCVSNMGLLYVGIFGFMINISDQISEQAYKLILILGAVMLFAGYRQDLNNLYLDTEDNVSMIKEKCSLPCVYLYKAGWQIQPNLMELKCLDNIIFVNVNHWDEEKESVYQNEPMIVYIPDEYADMLSEVKEYTGMTNNEFLFSAGYETVYVLQ